MEVYLSKCQNYPLYYSIQIILEIILVFFRPYGIDLILIWNEYNH